MKIRAREVTQLEKLVERSQEDLLSLKKFILPEGGEIPNSFGGQRKKGGRGCSGRRIRMKRTRDLGQAMGEM